MSLHLWTLKIYVPQCWKSTGHRLRCCVHFPGVLCVLYYYLIRRQLFILVKTTQCYIFEIDILIWLFVSGTGACGRKRRFASYVGVIGPRIWTNHHMSYCLLRIKLRFDFPARSNRTSMSRVTASCQLRFLLDFLKRLAILLSTGDNLNYRCQRQNRLYRACGSRFKVGKNRLCLVWGWIVPWHWFKGFV